MQLTELGPELHDLAVALGILDAAGNLRTEWFAHPLAESGTMFRDAGRRAALEDLIAGVVPADPGAPADPDSGETWHPLTGTGRHPVYLTVRRTGAALALGLAARVRGAAATVTLSLGLVEARNDGLHAVVGAPGHPVRARLDATVDPTGAIGFEGLSIDAALTPGAADPVRLTVAVQGLRVGDGVLPSVTLDPARLDRDLLPLLETLGQDRFARLAGDASMPAPLRALAGHLLPLVGAGGGAPRLAVERIGRDPGVLAQWFTGIVDGDPAPWLGHLAGLFGSTAPVTGAGTDADPWQVRLAEGIALTLAVRAGAAGRELGLGVALRFPGPGGLAVDGRAELLALPLSGPGAARAVPSATLAVAAPGDPSKALVATDTVHVGAARAGLSWDGATLHPVLELTGVVFEGVSYPRLDLSNVDTVRAAAAEAARAAFTAAIGTDGPGAHLAVLLGLVAPPGEAGAPVADLAALLAAPTRELARVHRARLLDPGHSWAVMLGRIAALLGRTGPVAGTGTADDPWRTPLGSTGPVTLDLAAWTGGPGGTTGELHLGLRATAAVTAGPATVDVTALAEVVRLDLPAAGPVASRLLGRHRARLAVTGPFTLSTVDGVGLTVAGIDARLDWTAGQSPAPVLELTGLTAHLPDGDVTLPVLQVPPAGGFDPHRPDLGLGIPPADLYRLARGLLARLWTATAGPDGARAAALFGLRTGEDRLPPDWPLPELPAGGMSALLADPATALRAWLHRVALELSLDDGPFARAGLAALRRLASPGSDTGLAVPGDGTWAAPWRVELAAEGGSELLVWLEPDGPPAQWAADSAQRAGTAETADELLVLMDRSGAPLAPLAAQFGGRDGPSAVDRIGDAWGTLLRRCADGDGVVPLAAQFPADPAWTAGTTLIDAAHHRLPTHPDAVAQILAQVNAWAPGAVLLVGPPFTGRDAWQPLLAAAEAAQAGSTAPTAHFDLRTPPRPELADLTATTVQARWYTADLADPGGDLAPVVAQIAAVVARIRQLRGAVPVAVVAHSTAGLAARAFAAAHHDQVAGIVTLGTPHGAAPLSILDDQTETDAARLAARLLDAGPVTGPLRDAVGHLLAAAEGWQTGATLPQRVSYPRDRFAGTTEHGTGGVPALALGGQLAGDPVAVLGTALATALAAPTGATAPTHLAFGLRVGLARTAPAPGGVAVDAGLRVDLARLSLDPTAAAGPAQPQRIAVEVLVDRPGGLLLDPADGAGVRLRRADLSVVVESGPGAGPVRAAAVFHDAGIDGPTTARTVLTDAGADRLLGAVVGVLGAAGTAGAAVLDALVALELAERDAAGAVTVLADAVEAVRTDAGEYLRPRLWAALGTAPGRLGLTGPSDGPWTATAPAAPLGFELTRDRLTVRLSGLTLAGADLTLETVRPLDGSPARVAGAAGPLRWDPDTRRLTLDPGAGQAAVTLVPPPDPAASAPVLLQRLAVAVGAVALTDRLGPGWTLGPLVDLLVHPGPVVAPNVDGEHAGALLRLLGGLVGAPPDGNGLALPGGLVLRASGVPGRISLRTEPPFPLPGVAGGPAGAATLDLDLDLDLAGTAAPTVGGRLNVDIPLGGTWGGLTLTLGLDHGVVSLAVTPRAADGTPLEPIVLLPRFGGLGPLAADAAQALLPAVLDALEARLPSPRPAVAAAVLAVADAAGLHGGGGDPSFAAHAGQLRALARPGGLTALAAADLPAAIGRLWTAAGLPGTVTPGATGVTVHASVGGLTLTLDGGWGATPAVRLSVAGLTAGPITLDPLTIGYTGGAVTGELTASVALPPAAESALGLRLRPALRIEAGAGGLTVSALPLGTGTDGLIRADLLPAARLVLGTGGAAALVERLAAPLAAQLAVDHCGALNAPLFTGGPSAAAVLRNAGVLATDAPRLVVPLPAAGDLVPRLLGALAATGATVPAGGLTLSLVTDHATTPPRLGLGLHGQADLGGGVSLRLGEPAPTWLPDGAPALRLLLIEQDTWRVRPSLRLAPLGLGLAGTGGNPLVDTDEVRLGGVTAYLWAGLDLDGGLAIAGLGGALDLDDLGLPLGAVGHGDTTSNPVAGSLLDSGRAAPAGDRQAVLPGLSLVAARRPGSDFVLLRRDGDAWIPFAARPLWLGVHRSFGPLSVDQVGFAHLPAPAGSGQPGTAQILVDGGVQVGPLTVQAHELGVDVPLDRLDQPGAWGLDLAGLAVAVRSDSVSLAGGLVRRAGPPVDYAGALTVQVAGRTFTAVGAYARPGDAAGSFTSLFVFAGIDTPLGGPPYLFVTGLGAGAGYNRRLVPPAQVTDVETFPLVTAIDNGVGDDPMGTLERLGNAMVPERGSLWLAAGVRFTSFSFVRSVAVAYVALDRGVEIGLVGVARASIPPPDAGPGSLELASVELALKARYSTAAGLLSVQAQLSDNSWLLSRDCQLTGGFAFFMWFHRDQFVLTLGGYHPAFVRPADFPVVPRLGFHWAVSDAIVVKGESYFALTSSSVMAGGRLEVSYHQSGVYASFTAYADLLVEWDPFHYDVAVGVTVTAGFRLRVCFFVCVTIDVSVTLGAKVHLVGPPLHGEAELDLEIATVTVAFGNEPHARPTFLDWTAFRDKYVVAGAPDGSALTVVPVTGLVPPDGPSAGPAPGSAANPWRLSGVFALRTETRVAATGYSVNGTVVNVPLGDGVLPVPAAVDLAPMNVAHVSVRHDLSLQSVNNPQHPVDLSRLDIAPVVGHMPAAVWRITGKPAASADVVPVLTGLVVTGQPVVADDGGRPQISLQVIDFNTEPVPIGLATAQAVTAPAAPRSIRPARLRGRRSSPPSTAPAPAVPAPAAAMPAPVPAASVPVGPGAVPPATPRLIAGVQVWDLPEGTGRWILTGRGTARVVLLDRAGHPRLDHEIVLAPEGTAVDPPPGAVRMAVVALDAAPAGRAAVYGWQSGSRLVQVAPATLLGRGATVHLPTVLPARSGGPAPIPAAVAVTGRPWVQTVLPADIDVLGVVVDATGTPGSLPTVRVEGGTVAAEPTVVAAGHRRYLLYRVTASDAQRLTVRVDTGGGWHAAGVLGLPGTVGDWAATLVTDRARHLVPDGPRSPDGTVAVRYEPAGAARPSTGAMA